jgi:hypothetical protein
MRKENYIGSCQLVSLVMKILLILKSNLRWIKVELSEIKNWYIGYWIDAKFVEQ